MRAADMAGAWTRRSVGLAVALVCGFASCAAHAARIDASFEHGGLQLRFSEPMRVWDNPRSDGLVRLQPELPTTCSWSSDLSLECDFGDASPTPATRYRIQVAAGLTTQQGVAVAPRMLEAETERPTLSAFAARWRDGLPTIRIASVLPATREAVAAALRLTVDGKPAGVPASALTPVPGSGWHHAVSFDLAADALGLSQVRDRIVELSVRPGLRSTAGPLPGTQDASLVRVLTRESFRIRGGQCTAPNGTTYARNREGVVALACVAGEPVELWFSRSLDPADEARWVAALPAGARFLGWSNQAGVYADDDRSIAGAPGRSARIVFDTPGVDATIDVRADLHASDTSTLIEPARIDLRIGPFRPALRAREQRRLVAGSDRMPAVLAEAVNTARVDIDVVGVGRTLHTGRAVAQAPALAQAQPIESDVTTRVLGEGGWARWRPDVGANPSTLEFAAPDFDLFAVAGRREVLAWANAWDVDAPVTGAQVELLWMDRADAAPRVIATAKTGRDGVARLRVPDAIADDAQAANGFPMWLLRASQGRGDRALRAVLPAWQPAAHNVSLAQAAPLQAWGVSDRPMYRSGDTVRYRLWQRQRSGGRLLRIETPPAYALQLFDRDRRRTILRWDATPDADGGIDGELALPVHLTDGTYCVGIGASHDVRGTCFFVGTHRAQDLWVEAKGEAPRVLRDGERFDVDVSAGYYSGGPAAGIALSRVTATVTPRGIGSAYPQHAAYSFIESFAGHGPVRLVDAVDPAPVTGPDGRARIAQPVAMRAPEATPVPFGDLRVVAELRPGDREATASNAATARYSRYARFAGLQVEPRVLDGHTPVTLQGLVIDAEGAVVDAPVEVVVDYQPHDAAADAASNVVARCSVPTREATTCDVPRKAAGRYRFTARSGDAAPATLVRHVWEGWTAPTTRQRSMLELLGRIESAGDAARFTLQQPHARARALLVFTAGNDTLLAHRVETLDGTIAQLTLPTSRDWRGTPVLHAFVREASPAQVVNGLREARGVTSLRVDVPMPSASGSDAPVTVAFDASQAAPGGQHVVRLHNASRQAREVTLTVVDDALRALAAPFLAYSDPAGHTWLGAPQYHAMPATAAFSQWQRAGPWEVRLPWTRSGDGAATTDAGVLLPPPPEAPPVVFDHPSPMDAPAPPPAPPSPPAPAPAADIGARADPYSTTLDRVEVTGSRFADAVAEAGSGRRDLELDDPRGSDMDRALQASARVRTHFAEAALWLPRIRLAPGETREVPLTLPDNLTRWRAIAWSNDADDDFHIAEATLETGLPIEVRLQTPMRLYPGDRARLAANLRQSGDAPADVQGTLQIDGLDPPVRDAQAVTLAPRGQASIATAIAPAAPGMLQVLAMAEADAGRDAIAATIEVAPPTIRGRRLQAGWLGDAPVSLALPQLPDSASNAHLNVTLQHGVAGLVSRWTGDMRDYHHRCWEQILSRAVAAALAIERGDTAAWPDAGAAVREALDNAAVFQNRGGDFRFFADGEDAMYAGARAQFALTAWTVRAFDELRRLGHPVDAGIDQRARDFLAGRAREPLPTAADAAAANERAFALGTFHDVPVNLLDDAFARWELLAMPARIALASGLRHAHHASADDALARLLQQAPAQGAVRTLRGAGDATRWMGSPLREQCALIDLLRGDVTHAHERRALIAGLGDLYAGGTPSVDTQSGAMCLLALRDVARPGGGTVSAALQPGTPAERMLTVAPGDVQAETQGALPADGRLAIANRSSGDAPAGYIAEIAFDEDAREARASAVGFSIERQYAVLRDGAWTPIDGAKVREGDWLRVTLIVRTSATRWFVAVTDAVPGGLRPTDLALGAIAGLDLQQVSDAGSGWFATRRLDPRSPRFYAERLPAGTHALHYFLRAGNGGDYLAAPATAELMYGGAGNARTAAQRVVVDAGP
ncbi:MAG: alpha-2-macroglobulin family protein [Luteimonas sp.]